MFEKSVRHHFREGVSRVTEREETLTEGRKSEIRTTKKTMDINNDGIKSLLEAEAEAAQIIQQARDCTFTCSNFLLRLKESM